LSKKSEKEVDERKVNETVKQIENLIKSKSNASGGGVNGNENGDKNVENSKKNKSKSDLKKNGKKNGGDGGDNDDYDDNGKIRNGYESDLDHSPNGMKKRNRRRHKKENGGMNEESGEENGNAGNPNKSRNGSKMQNESFINGNGNPDYESTGGGGYDSNMDSAKKHRTRREINSLTGKEYEDKLARDREGSKLSLNSSRRDDTDGGQKSSRSSRLKDKKDSSSRSEMNGSRLTNSSTFNNENPSEEQKEDLFREKNIVVNKAVDDIDDPENLTKRPLKKAYNSTNKDIDDENGDEVDGLTSPRNRQAINPTPKKTLKESSTQTPRDVSIF
jgi:hypothetical protein